MKGKTVMSLAVAALSLAVAALAQTKPAATVTTPEGATMQVSDDLAYKPGELTPEQLTRSARSLFTQDSMNVFRRFPREKTEEMVKFYTQALALRPLNPIQLTSTQQMLLTGVGSGQVKLSAGQQGDRKYDLAGGYKAGTGIRFLALTYPDADAVTKAFAAAGRPAPEFRDQGDGTKAALVTDPADFQIEIVIRPGAKHNSDDGVGIGIGVSDLEKSRAFYRDFVGLDELPPEQDRLLGVTKYPYRHKETTVYLYKIDKTGDDLPADTGSSGIQYVVGDAAMVDAKGKARGVTVETPLNKLDGFGLITVWLNDPDGVTNYFAQVGAR
ncbi:MAG: VOC family protein [Acidobacteriota bacterium]|jgi:catechol 2,3-dioxygenase-like lactoylglutathione lyase family enzyme|nr:VOC family protein [Acidobacteriota bacterium]